MSRFVFIHAADLHLDTPFVGIGRSAPEVAEALRDASLGAFDSLVRLAIDRDAAFLVIAGDIYDGSDRGLRAQLRFLNGLRQLSEHGIQTFVIHGNHDPVEEGWSAIRAWPNGVTIFGSSDVSSVRVERNGEYLATIHGISYPRRDVTENLALRFRRQHEPGFHVGVLHCNVGGDSNHAAYSPCSLDDLRSVAIDYWALGHIHARQVLQDHAPCVVYPGNLQARSVRPSEQGAKGAAVVDVDGDEVVGLDFVALDRVRFVSITVDIQGVEDLAVLRDRSLREAELVRAEHSGRSLIVQASVVGRGPLNEDLRRPGSQADLLQQLRDDAVGMNPFLWWNAIRIQSRPSINREDVLNRGDFAAEVLRVGQILASEAARYEAFWAGQMAALETGDRRGLVGGVEDAEERHQFLRDAEELALDVLERESET